MINPDLLKCDDETLNEFCERIEAVVIDLQNENYASTEAQELMEYESQIILQEYYADLAVREDAETC